LHDYALPQTIDIWFGGMTRMVEDLATAPIELVVVATDLTDAPATDTDTGFELVYSSRATPPAELAQAILASAAVSALVMPLRVGDRVATDGAWVRNFPLAHAYSHEEVELIVAFRYVAQYPRLGVEALQPLRKRLMRFRKIPPVRAFIAEIDEAEARAARGEPAHLADMIVRLARVTIRRNTQAEERVAEATDLSLRELRSLRHDVLGLVDEPGLHEAVAARFAAANFPFRKERLIPRIIVRGATEGPGLEPGLRNQPRWSEEEKRTLIRRGWALADEQLREIAVDEVTGRLDVD
jgi:predicted acylesterase/phospholipase RssA